MSFARYPKYKDSGVEWLGEVPENWSVVPLKHLAEFVNGDAFKPTEWAVSGIPIIRIQNLNGSEDFNYYDGEVEQRYLVHDGDLLFGWSGNRGTSFGPFLWSRDEVCVLNQHIFRVVPNLAEKRSLYWTLKAVTAHVEDQAHGIIGMVHVTKGDLGAINVPVPPLPEQTQIAAFLDRETAKIDELVAEQRRLMELLKEKRQAVISHAVTKGLNPDAPMKPSGIGWLGDVPAHWEVLKGSLIGTLFGSEQIPEESVADEGDLPFIKVGSLSSDSFSIESWDWFVDRAVADRYKPQSGFIVFPKRGAAIFNNKVNIVDRPSLIDPNLMGWAIGNRAITAFIAYALKSRKLNELADVSTVPQINNKHIAPERFPVPPLDEQYRIVAHLNTELAKLDTLTTEAQRAIDLLQEHRTALISAAVTGQIDVRAAL